MPTGTISRFSKAIEKGVLGVIEASSVNQGGPGNSAKVLAPISQVLHTSFQGAVFLEGCKQIMSHISMPILATFYHHDDETAPSFVVLKSHKAPTI